MPGDDFKKRGCDRIGARFPGPLAVEHVAPPLQPDFARQRLARRVTHACHLDIEGKKRMKRAAQVRRRKECRDIAIAIASPDQLGAIGECILHCGKLNRISPSR